MGFIHEFLFDHPILSLLQVAFTVWMAVEASRSGNTTWIWLITAPADRAVDLLLRRNARRRVFGRLFGRLPGVSASLRRRKASLDQLEFQVQQSPTLANQLAMADRLVVPPICGCGQPPGGALKREPNFAPASFALARCKRRTRTTRRRRNGCSRPS